MFGQRDLAYESDSGTYIRGDVLRGDQGDDWYDGGLDPRSFFRQRADQILLSSSPRAVVVDFRTHTITGQGRDRFAVQEWFVVGSDGDDVMYGGPGRQTLSGRNGDDQLFGRGGDDSLLDGPGDDLLAGGTGDDWLGGGRGDDRLRGGGGEDQVWSRGQSSDRTYGGAGRDLISEVLVGKPGEVVHGGAAADDLFVRVDALQDQPNRVVYDAATGTATVGTTPVTIGGFESLRLKNGFWIYQGSDQRDVVFSNRLVRVTAFGNGGNDLIYGGHRNDRIEGGAGDDAIVGSLGDDLLVGGDGSDTVSPGSGTDTCLGFEKGSLAGCEVTG